MAAITGATAGSLRVEARSSAATVTDWIDVPSWASYAHIFVQPTTIGTNIALSILAADPVSRDDANVLNVAEHGALTAITANTGSYVIQIGPGVTGIADETTISATADSYASLNAVLPPLLGVRQVNTGTNVYNLSVTFRK